MQPKTKRSGLAAALLAGTLLLAPTARAGSFSSSAFLDLTLTSPLPDSVTLTYDNAVVFADDFASNPPRSWYDADTLFTDEPALGSYGTVMTAIGESLSADRTPAASRSTRWTAGSLAIGNGSSGEVTLDFDYAFAIVAEVFAQSTGSSAANAFARVELFWDNDSIVDALVAAALDGLTAEDRSGSGSVTIAVPAGETRTLSFFVDAAGDTTHVPVPAGIALVATGLGLLGLSGLRRRVAR